MFEYFVPNHTIAVCKNGRAMLLHRVTGELHKFFLETGGIKARDVAFSSANTSMTDRYISHGSDIGHFATRKLTKFFLSDLPYVTDKSIGHSRTSI